MAISLHVRDLPEHLHAALAARAESEGMSLRGYVIRVLTEHASLPTVDEWLNGLARLPGVTPATPAAEAVRAAREADDEELLAVATRR